MFNKNQVRVDTIINYGNRLEKIPVSIPMNSTLDEAIKQLPGACIELDETMGPFLTRLKGLKIKKGSGIQVYFVNENGEKGLPAVIDKSKEVKFPGIGNVTVNKNILIVIQVDDFINDLNVPGCLGALVKPKEQFLASECDLVLANVQGERKIETRPDYFNYPLHILTSTSFSSTSSRNIIPPIVPVQKMQNTFPMLKQDSNQQTYFFNYPIFSQTYIPLKQQTPAIQMTKTETKKELEINPFAISMTSSIKATKQNLQKITLPIKTGFMKSISRIKTVVQSIPQIKAKIMKSVSQIKIIVQSIPQVIQNIPQIIQKTTMRLSHAAHETHKHISKVLATITSTVDTMKKRIKISSQANLIQNTIRKTKINLANILKLLFAPRKKEKEQTLQAQSNNSFGFSFWNILQGFAHSFFVLPGRLNNSTYFYFIAFVLLAITAAYCLLK